MFLGKQRCHGGEAEDEVVAGDAEEHQGAHGLAACHEGAEDEEKSRLDGTHTGHIGQGIGEEEHQAGEQLHLPEAEAAGQTHEPNVVKAAWNIFGRSYEYRKKYNEYKQKRMAEEKEVAANVDGQMSLGDLYENFDD